MELETINKLYLELSQVATAKTKRELELEAELDHLNKSSGTSIKVRDALYTLVNAVLSPELTHNPYARQIAIREAVKQAGNVLGVEFYMP